MIRTASILSLALLFIASLDPSHGQTAEMVTAPRVVTARAGAPLLVECGLRPEQRAVWTLDGSVPPADMVVGEVAAGGLRATLSAVSARAHHAGLYRCSPDSPPVRVVVSTAPAGSETTTVTSSAVGGGTAAEAELSDAADILYYDIRGNFSLDCSSLVTDRGVELFWSKNGTRLEEVAEYQRGHVVLLPAGGMQRALLTLTGRALETDYGNYTCSLGAGRTASKDWRVHGRTYVKLPSDSNVVEGQKLKLTCKLLGRPYPAVAWYYSNDTESENATFVPVEQVLGTRATVRESEQHVQGAELVVDPAAREDAGLYKCQVVTTTGTGGASAVTRLRVKDMYAALWPFLGICAEVFVLCAIILVYEKRRTKPELDDSDTDNHDQKKS